MKRKKLTASMIALVMSVSLPMTTYAATVSYTHLDVYKRQNQMGSFNSVGATYDLTPYLEENNNEWRDSLLAPAVQSGTVNDQVFCIPFRTTCTVLAYNKDVYKRQGGYRGDEPAGQCIDVSCAEPGAD